MKRRDFVYGSAAVVGAAALAKTDALAQTAPVLSATRTFQLFDSSSSSGQPVCRDVIFDGRNFLSLFTSGPGAPASNLAATATATTSGGERLWSYPLPEGRYFRLGTYGGLIAIFASGYLGHAQTLVASAVLLLDPQTGKLSDLGPESQVANLRYAGDSTFFKATQGRGEIWTLESAFTKKIGGITAQALAAPAPMVEYLQSGNVVVTPRDGAFMAVISAASGSVIEHPISSDLVTASRNFYASSPLPNGSANSKVVIVSAIGGDQAGSILAIVNGPQPIRAGVSLIQMDSSASAAYLGQIQLPLNDGGIPVLPLKLVGLNSEIGTVTGAGTVAWYARPAV